MATNKVFGSRLVHIEQAQPANVAQLRRVAPSGTMRSAALAIVDEWRELRRRRDDLLVPSRRLGVVCWFFDVKALDELDLERQKFAESVALEHDGRTLLAFDAKLEARAEALRDRAAAWETAAHRALVGLIANEITNTVGILRPVFDEHGCDVENAEPVQMLRAAHAHSESIASGELVINLRGHDAERILAEWL